MRLLVEHETRYDYQPAARDAHHMAHLRPRDDGGQRLLDHQLVITPAASERWEDRDTWGNHRLWFAIPAEHAQLRLLARSIVDTAAPPPPAPGLPWERVREALRYRRGGTFDAAVEFALPSPLVPRHEDFVAYARASFAADRPLPEAAADLMARIHADFRYEPQATDVSTPVLQTLAARRGVCQDFAHVMIAALRAMGLAARYVSGYLLTEPPPGQPRLLGADASHAWVSVWSPSASDGLAGGQWLDLDPTNNRVPGEDYVTLAVGRDYSDVSPVRGVIHGGARHTLTVAVTVAPTDADRLRPHPDGGMAAAACVAAPGGGPPGAFSITDPQTTP